MDFQLAYTILTDCYGRAEDAEQYGERHCCGNCIAYEDGYCYYTSHARAAHEDCEMTYNPDVQMFGEWSHYKPAIAAAARLREMQRDIDSSQTRISKFFDK